MTESQQLTLWDLPAGRGRPRHQPWGLPRRLWDISRNRAWRRGKKNREEILEALQGVILEEQARPWWVPPRVDLPPEPKKIHRVIEETVVPCDRVTPSLRRMVESGMLPGHRWDSSRGVIRESIVMRVVG